ncbi:MAG TPA: hypothetical protein V6C65_19230, partial [Allocoleopsis sp.]
CFPLLPSYFPCTTGCDRAKASNPRQLKFYLKEFALAQQNSRTNKLYFSQKKSITLFLEFDRA